MKLFLFLALLQIEAAFSEDINVNELMKKAQNVSYYQGKDGKAQVLMKVYASKEATPIKKVFYMLRYDVADGGEQMFFTYFTHPSDLKRTTFLVHKKIDKDDYRRLYMPASDKVLAIAGSRKQDPFMGSDFSYEDVSGRHFTKDNHKILKTDQLKGEAVYIVESVPKSKEPKIAKITSWISKTDYTPLKVEYTNHDGKVYRVYEAEKSEVVDGFKTVTKRKMTSPLEGSFTEMLFNPSNLKYNIGLKEADFKDRSLKNPPMEYLK